MNTEAQFYTEGQQIDHTPASAMTAGDVVKVGGRAAIVPTGGIAASAMGSLVYRGHAKVAFKAEHAEDGMVIGWDEDGDPYGGDAGSGAATIALADADFILGSVVGETTATAGEVIVDLNQFVPDLPYWAGKVYETISDNKTLDVEDIGKVFQIGTDAKTFTLPAWSTAFDGIEWIFQNIGADAAVALTISPNASDKIMGPDVAGTDDHDEINTKLTAKQGDWMILTGDGVNGWYMKAKRGIWAQA